MKSPVSKRRGGFTLIELLAVITIIIILAGLVVAGLGFVREKQDREKAKIQVALIGKALEEYKLDMGFYPGDSANSPSTGDISSELYGVLFFEGYDYKVQGEPKVWTKTVGGVQVEKARKIYLPELDPKTSKQGWVDIISQTASMPFSIPIKDPWGNNYRYRKGTTSVNPDFDFWSSGKDGKTSSSSSTPDTADTRDDIRNF